MPTVSILVTTFNRTDVLRRALRSVVQQTFKDFEVIVIDDASSQDTESVIRKINDPRIRLIRNKVNVGQLRGDRAHIKRFVDDLCNGQYFVYLCDDDYWLQNDLLERQVRAFELYPGVAFVQGGQLSNMMRKNDDAQELACCEQDLRNIFDFEAKKPKSNQFYFHTSLKNHEYSLFSTWYLTSKQYLQEFCEEPTSKNIIVGATLYNLKIFKKSGTFRSSHGSKWQAGYELLIGPAIFGDVIYINEPCIMVEVKETNASFQRTQVDHYQDSVISAVLAFQKGLRDFDCPIPAPELRRLRSKAILNLGRIYITNSVHTMTTGELGMCSSENLSRLVSPIHHIRNSIRFRILHFLKWKDFCLTAKYLLSLIRKFSRTLK